MSAIFSPALATRLTSETRLVAHLQVEPELRGPAPCPDRKAVSAVMPCFAVEDSGAHVHSLQRAWEYTTVTRTPTGKAGKLPGTLAICKSRLALSSRQLTLIGA
jgi:hypothetical protein